MYQTNKTKLYVYYCIKQHVSILIESSSGPSKNTDPYLAFIYPLITRRQSAYHCFISNLKYVYFRFMWRCSPLQAQAAHLQMFLDRTQLDTQLVGLLSASDQPITETTTYTAHNKPQQTKNRALSGTQICNPSNQGVVDIHLRPHVHRDRPLNLLFVFKALSISIQWTLHICTYKFVRTIRPDKKMRGSVHVPNSLRGH